MNAVDEQDRVAAGRNEEPESLFDEAPGDGGEAAEPFDVVARREQDGVEADTLDSVLDAVIAAFVFGQGEVEVLRVSHRRGLLTKVGRRAGRPAGTG